MISIYFSHHLRIPDLFSAPLEACVVDPHAWIGLAIISGWSRGITWAPDFEKTVADEVLELE